MRVLDNAHSRLVALLKVVLPLTALAILSTVFLIAGRGPEPGELPYAELDVARMAREGGLASPTYTAVTDTGAAIQVAATSAIPARGDRDGTEAEALTARIEMPGGEVADIESDNGEIDNAAGDATLRGDVVVTTTSGYRVETEELRTALDLATAESPGAIRGRGPLGRLTAGRMTLGPADDGPGYLLRFTDGVRLVYTAPTDTSAEASAAPALAR